MSHPKPVLADHEITFMLQNKHLLVVDFFLVQHHQQKPQCVLIVRGMNIKRFHHYLFLDVRSETSTGDDTNAKTDFLR